MKNPGKPGKKSNKPQDNKNFSHGGQKPAKPQKIIKPTVRGR